MNKKRIAFVCVHNSCRSQIAEALCHHFRKDEFEAYSAGTHLKDRINPDAVRLMKKIYYIDMELTQKPKLLQDIPSVDIVITMGCEVECPYVPSQHREDWGLEDPTGQDEATFLSVIARIEQKIKQMEF